MKPTIDSAILFGSRAKGTARVDSDADIAILANDSLSLDDTIALGEEMTGLLGISEDKIDLVELRHASPLLQHQVGEEGKLLFGDPQKFVRFRVLAWKRYLDTAKFRRAGEPALKQQYAA